MALICPSKVDLTGFELIIKGGVFIGELFRCGNFYSKLEPPLTGVEHLPFLLVLSVNRNTGITTLNAIPTVLIFGKARRLTIFIPAYQKKRKVIYASSEPPCIWLAVRYVDESVPLTVLVI